MSSNVRWGALILSLVLALAIGYGAYHYGFSQGVASSPQVAAAIRDSGPGGYLYAYPWHHGPFGFGFFPFFPFFAIFICFLIARLIFWGGPWGRHRGWYGPDRVPPMFDDWHRRAHQEGKSAGASS
jgi:hypothetical protein